jgi:hypothetical protein
MGVYEITYSLRHHSSLIYTWQPFQYIKMGLSLLLILIVATRYFWRKMLASKYPSLRPALKDEFSRACWLQSFRPTFYFLLFIQIASKIHYVTWPRVGWDFPSLPLLTLSAAVMSLTGFFLYYNRGGRHE